MTVVPVEIRPQPAVGEVVDGSVCAETAAQALKHLHVADESRTL